MTVLFAAGSETVARHLGWAVDLLDQHPEQRAELAADPTLIPNAVEEILRFEPPSPVNARYVTSDVTLPRRDDPRPSRGSCCVTGSAGRDERTYPNPDVFDIHRKFDLHVTFGYGIHFCLGAALGAHGGPDRGGGDAQALAGMDGRPRPGRAALHEHRARLPEPAHRHLNRRRARSEDAAHDDVR